MGALSIGGIENGTCFEEKKDRSSCVTDNWFTYYDYAFFMDGFNIV
jgi:hypothetical protein